MENSKPEFCSSCHQKIRPLNPHGMDKTKVRVLNDIGLIITRGHKWAKVVADPATIKPEEADRTFATDDVHVSRLRWFGLVETRERRSGLYRVTEKGILFLCGEQSIPETIWCRDGKVVEESRARVYIHQVRHVVYSKIHWDNYRATQRPDRIGKEAMPLFQ